MKKAQAFKIVGFVLGHVFSLILVLIPVFHGSFLHKKGSEPEKHLTQVDGLLLHPLRDLQNIASSDTVALSIGKRSFTNLFVLDSAVTNIGSSPIVPDDFHAPLSINVPAPWEIITVKSKVENTQQISTLWQSSNAQKFIAAPVLINPGDSLNVVIYITHPSLPPFSTVDVPKQPSITWDARITNLRSIERGSSQLLSAMQEIFDIFSGGLYSFLSGKGLFFTFAVGMTNMAILLYLAGNAKLTMKPNPKLLMIIVGVTTLSVTVGESLSSYVFGDLLTKILNMIDIVQGRDPGGVDYINAIPLVIDAILIVALLNWKKLKKWYSRFRSDETAERVESIYPNGEH